MQISKFRRISENEKKMSKEMSRERCKKNIGIRGTVYLTRFVCALGIGGVIGGSFDIYSTYIIIYPNTANKQKKQVQQQQLLPYVFLHISIGESTWKSKT